MTQWSQRGGLLAGFALKWNSKYLIWGLTLYTFPSVSPTFLSRPKRRISEGPQNRHLFKRWPHSTWTVIRRAIFSSSEIKKSLGGKSSECCNNSIFNSIILAIETIAFILVGEQTRHPTCRDFFHIQFFVQNWKNCTLRYAYGLNYFTHWKKSIVMASPRYIVVAVRLRLPFVQAHTPRGRSLKIDSTVARIELHHYNWFLLIPPESSWLFVDP